METTDKLLKTSNIKYTQKSSIAGEMEITIDSERVVERMESNFEKIRHKAELPGFRKGRVPMNIVRQKYRSEVIRDTFEDLVSRACHIAAEKKEVPIVGAPKVKKTNWLNWDEKSPMEFTALVELVPSPKLKKYKGLEFTVTAITEKEMDSEYNAVLKKIMGPYVTLEEMKAKRGVRADDIVCMDLKVTIDGHHSPTHSLVNKMFEIGASALPQKLENEILGMSVGEEKKLEEIYPQNHPQIEVAGKKLLEEIKILEIKTKKYPELTDEFIEENWKTDPKKWKEEMRSLVKKEMKGKQKVEKESALITELLKANPLEVPETMIHQRLDVILDSMFNGLKPSYPMEEIKKTIEGNMPKHIKRAENDVKASLLFEKVIEKVNPSVSDEEVKARIAQSTQPNQPAQSDSPQKPKSEKIAAREIKFEKALNYMMEHSKIKEKT